MRHLLILFCAVLMSISASAQSQHVSPIEKYDVPKKARKAQSALYPKAEVFQWQKHILTNDQQEQTTEYRALFTQSGYKGEVIYDYQGNGQYSVLHLDMEQIPGSIVAGLKDTYPSYEVTDGEKIKFLNDGTFAYRIVIAKGSLTKELWVDLQGRELDKTPLVRALNGLNAADLVAK